MAQENAQMKQAREQAEKTGTVEHDWPRDAFGTPLVKISCAASELIATRNFSNVTVGPVVVTRFVPDGDSEHLLKEIGETQGLCERAVADERQTVHSLIQKSTEGRA